MRFSASNRRNLKGVDPRLQKLFLDAAAEHDPAPRVTEGVRTIERQRQLVKKGASRTLKSKHLTGKAIDIVFVIDGVARWDWPLYHAFAQRMKRLALNRRLDLTWGGDWKTFKDGPHFQLNN